MVRTLNRPAKIDSQTLLFPGATEAEPWEVWTAGPDANCLQVCQTPAESGAGRGTLALPVRQVIALPLWLQETDSKQFPGMIALQLESQGLRPRGREPVFDWSVVRVEASRTLVLVGVLPTRLPEELEATAFSTFEVSARCLALPEDSLVFWKEHDRLALAVTHGPALAFFHALADETFTTRALQDINCIMASLQMQEAIESPKQILVWTTLTSSETNALSDLFRLPIREDRRPAPRAPAQNWSLTPARVGDVRRNRVVRRWWIRGLLFASLLILSLAAAMILRLFLAERDIAQLKQWQSSHAASLSMVHDTREAWRDLQPVVDTDRYPLETLFQVSDALPADQVRMTLFEAEGNHLLIKAEAKNLTAAFQFFDALKRKPQLKGYSWEMAQPHSLANDVTQLQIEGTHAVND